MVYFDNAATSFPKPKSVIRSLDDCIRNYCGNPGRSAHPLSVKSAEKIYEARLSVASLLGIDSEEKVCFTKNATEALNIAIKCSVTEKCHCIISDFEHNSVLRPLESLKNTLGVEYTAFDSDKPLPEAIIPLIRDDTRFIIASLVSNVTGKKLNLKELADIAENNNLELIIDASQAAGHLNINLSETPCNILCAPGHKALFGIQGSGILVICDGKVRPTLSEGGSGSESFSRSMPSVLPERYEAGTVSTPAIVTLGAGVEFIKSVGIENVNNKISYLTERAFDILSSLKRVKIYGHGEGIISFNVYGVNSYECADYLSQFGIYTRGGYHCSPIIHEKLGTGSGGTVRLSFSYFNKPKEIDRLYTVLKNLTEKI